MQVPKPAAGKAAPKLATKGGKAAPAPEPELEPEPEVSQPRPAQPPKPLAGQQTLCTQQMLFPRKWNYITRVSTWWLCSHTGARGSGRGGPADGCR